MGIYAGVKDKKYLWMDYLINDTQKCWENHELQ